MFFFFFFFFIKAAEVFFIFVKCFALPWIVLQACEVFLRPEKYSEGQWIVLLASVVLAIELFWSRIKCSTDSWNVLHADEGFFQACEVLCRPVKCFARQWSVLKAVQVFWRPAKYLAGPWCVSDDKWRNFNTMFTTCHASYSMYYVCLCVFFWGGEGTNWLSQSVEGLLLTRPNPFSFSQI